MSTPDVVVLTHALEHARLVLRNSNAEPSHTLDLLKKILYHGDLDEALGRIRRDNVDLANRRTTPPGGQ